MEGHQDEAPRHWAEDMTDKPDIPGVEKYRSRMLEVTVTPDRPPRWEWQVCSNGEMIANGFENGQIEAKFEGYNAMFLLLAAGWNA
jgi:hypothetical protein